MSHEGQTVLHISLISVWKTRQTLLSNSDFALHWSVVMQSSHDIQGNIALEVIWKRKIFTFSVQRTESLSIWPHFIKVLMCITEVLCTCLKGCKALQETAWVMIRKRLYPFLNLFATLRLPAFRIRSKSYAAYNSPELAFYVTFCWVTFC